MNIYQVYHDCDVYDSLYFINEDDDDFLDRFFGFTIYQNQPNRPTWKPLVVEFEREEKRTEFPNLSGRFACSDKAWQIIAPLINNHVELLPLQCELGNYYIVKTERIDCLDYSRAVVERFDDSERVMEVVSYAFKEDCLKDKHLFTIPEEFATNFVSQTFKDCIEANGLEGLIFRQITS
jgi:hypothetical protein